MALENRLDLRLSQKLVLTPQLQQAIKLLQLPQLELAQVLNQELSENPFLEEIYEEVESEVEAGPSHEEEPRNVESSDDGELSVENLTKFSVDDYFEERSSDGRDLGYFSPDFEEKPSYELFYSQKPDLYSHLLWQLRLCSADDNVRRAAEVVIGNLDEDGYLRASEEELMTASGDTPVDGRGSYRAGSKFRSLWCRRSGPQGMSAAPGEGPRSWRNSG